MARRKNLKKHTKKNKGRKVRKTMRMYRGGEESLNSLKVEGNSMAENS